MKIEKLCFPTTQRNEKECVWVRERDSVRESVCQKERERERERESENEI